MEVRQISRFGDFFMRGVTALVLALAIVALALGSSSRSVDFEAVRAEARRATTEGKLTLARKLLREALHELRQKETKPTQWAADLLVDLGGIYRQLNQQSEAIAALEEGSEVLMALHGRGDPRYAMALDKMADAHMQASDYDLARKVYNNLLEAMRESSGSSHPGYEMTLGKAAYAALQANQPRAAIKGYTELLGIQEAKGPAPKGQEVPTIAGVAQLRVQYAQALAAVGELSDALEQALQAEQAYASEPSLMHSLEHAASLNGVAGVLEKLGRDELAVTYMAKALDAAQAVVSADPEMDPKLVESAQANLNGLKKHVARKQAKQRQREAEAQEL
jgi:tetratricopeptide (TPR) repeat protein